MGHSVISLGLGLGGGKFGTVSGRSAGAGFAYNLDSNFGIDTVPSLHLDASILDGSDSANNPSDGTAVATWGDRSGNGNDFTEATNQPLFRSSLLRGKPGVEFDGVDDVLSDTDFFSNADFSGEEATVVFVNIPGSSSGTFGVGTQDTSYNTVRTSPASSTQDNFFGNGDYSGQFLNMRTGNTGNTNYTVPSTSRPQILAYQVDTSYRRLANGREFFNKTLSTLGASFATNSGGCLLGGVSEGRPLQGFICEVLIFNSVISASDLDTVHNYLGNKYGISVYTQRSSSTYALDGSNNTSFHPIFHFDANESGTVLDASYNNVTDGNDVVFWKDKVNGFYAAQPTATRQPNFVSSRTVGGTSTTSSAIYFDGTGESLELWNEWLLGDFTHGDKTAVIIFEPNSDSSYELYSRAGAGPLYSSGVCRASTFRTSRLGGVALANLSTTNGQMVEIYQDVTANTYDIESEGSACITQTTSNYPTGTSPNYTAQLGGSGLTPNERTNDRLNGWIYEVIIFDDIVSSADKTALVAYAKAKYGI